MTLHAWQLFGLTLLLWAVAAYLSPEPLTIARLTAARRGTFVLQSVAATAGTTLALALAYRSWHGAVVGVSIGVAAALLQLTRPHAGAVRRLAEWEIGWNAAVAVAAMLAADRSAPYPVVSSHPIAPPALMLSLAAAILATRAGGLVVRGVLDKVGIHPETTDAKRGVRDGVVDDDEYRRGRLIGYLERLIVLALVARGDLSALGFLIGAKGLVRSRELDDHEFAEYFLIGTLASVAVAFFVGLALRWTLSAV